MISASAALLDKLDHLSGKRTFQWRFGDVAYTKKGTGSPLLLLHDLHPGASGYEWNRIEDALAKEHTLYIIDLPGCGRSDKPSIVYTNFLYVQMISVFIKEVIRDKTAVLTSGYSASLAVMTAQYDKDMITSISMINPPDPASLKYTPGIKERICRQIIELPVFGTMIYHIAMCKSNLENDFIEKYYYNPFHVDGDMIDAYYEAAHKNASAGKYLYASKQTGYMNINILPALQKTDIPVKIFVGDTEPEAPTSVANYEAVVKNISTICIPNAKHFPHIENAEAFLSAFH
jgi:pimeloyl-ACP methyl ester carboxylesterase